MKYTVRNARVEDIKRITTMLTFAEPRLAHLQPEEYIKRFMRKPYYNPDMHFVLTADKEIVGELLASLDVGYGVLKGGCIGVRISILPEHQRIDTVSLLLEHIMPMLRAYESLQITVSQNKELERILESLGFTYLFSGYWMVKEDTWIPEVRVPDGVLVRCIADAEIERFYEVVNRAFSTDPHWAPYSFSEFAEKYIYPEHVDFNGYFVAEFSGQFVGTVAAWAHRNGKLDGGEIRALGVVKEYRNRGIGKLLLARALEYLINKGMKKFYLGTDSYNLPALRIYENFGFRVFRESRRYMLRIKGTKGER